MNPFGLFNPMNWLILKPMTVREALIDDTTPIERDIFFDKENTRPRKHNKSPKKPYGTKKNKKSRFNKTKGMKRK